LYVHELGIWSTNFHASILFSLFPANNLYRKIFVVFGFLQYEKVSLIHTEYIYTLNWERWEGDCPEAHLFPPSSFKKVEKRKGGKWKGGNVERWKGRKMKRWKRGKMEKGKVRKVERWKIGKEERWKGGKVERWKGGKVEQWKG
jgi:hypothetical protein